MLDTPLQAVGLFISFKSALLLITNQTTIHHQLWYTDFRYVGGVR